MADAKRVADQYESYDFEYPNGGRETPASELPAGSSPEILNGYVALAFLAGPRAERVRLADGTVGLVRLRANRTRSFRPEI